MSSNQPNTSILGPPPPLLRVVETPDRGRALVTTCRITPGQIVMVDSPLVVYPSSLGCLPLFCSCCFRVLPSEPFRCPSCHVARFCSVRCLSLSHPRLLCHALPSLISGNTTWPDDLLFLLSAYSLPSRKLLQILYLHSSSSFPEESIETLHSELASLLPSHTVPVLFSRGNTSSLISNEKNNSFALINPMDPKYEDCGVAGARAYGLYLWASMLNHDCIPNVCRFDYVDDPNREKNTDFVFRALHEIKEGSEICTSYIGVTREYKERQRKLMEDYGFKCECERCKIESQWEEEDLGEEEKNKEMSKEDNEEENEEVNEEENEEANEGEEVEVGEGDDYDGCLIADFIQRYVCDCGGFLAPLPPLQDGTVSNLVECNGCGNVSKDEPGDDGDPNS